MTREIDADYLVVGAGATGLAFTDALIDHSPEARVALVDRRGGIGGHWRGAYPFVRLHQASTFYGVASTVLGGRLQTSGPEAGLQERADQTAIRAYYDAVFADRMLASGRVELFAGCHYGGERTFVAIDSGEQYVVPEACRVVDARYLAPEIPAETPPRFDVLDGARVVAVNDLPLVDDEVRRPSQYVVVGSGKTATDAVIWLLDRGVDPDEICWVRPRDPWMLNRAVVQPDPAVYLGMVADTMAAAAAGSSLDDVFLRLEDAGVMLRVDRSVTPTMAKAPTLATWELDQLRSITHVVRRGRVRSVSGDRIDLTDGSVSIARDAVIVNCAADGLKNPPRMPIWRSDAITLQPVRAGFPCFGAALIGYVEATRDDDREKNRLCAPSSYANSLTEWAQMTVLGLRNSAAFGVEPDIKAWADTVALNPGRIPPGHPRTADLDDAIARLAVSVGPGITRLAELGSTSMQR